MSVYVQVVVVVVEHSQLSVVGSISVPLIQGRPNGELTGQAKQIWEKALISGMSKSTVLVLVMLLIQILYIELGNLSHNM